MKDGDGELEIVDGEVLGFDGAESVSKLLGGKPLRFHSAHVTFSLDGKTIYIIPGSRVSAPKGDTAYKYVMIDGNVTTDQSINLSCIGNVNIRALNSFVAGIQGVLSTAFENGKTRTSEELLQNFLGSAITGFTKNEFRDVSLKVSGEPGNILFSDVSIASPVKADTMPAILSESSGTRGKEDERIQIKVEFPVGPGGSSPSESVGGQVGGQLLDQVLKGLIFD
jgi:translocation and assembly module TamB